jgi:hypothetical protein
MTFCSLSEAWGQGPDGIDTGKYQAVNYEDSNIYKCSGEPVFEKQKPKMPVKRIPNMSRTQERLPQHNGPANRYSENVTSVSINYDDNNSVSVDKSEIPYNKKNNELPITQYSKYVKSKNKKHISSPIHEIKYRNKSKKIDSKVKEEDLNDTIDNIINSVDDSSQASTDSVSTSSTDSISEDKPVPINTRFKELIKKYKNKNDIIKYLILQNEKLTKLIKKKSMIEKPNGIFSQWDLLIVVCLGILMIIVLEYVYKIAISKN